MGFTDIITFLLIAIGLCFDSFAVSVSVGLMKRQIKFAEALPVAFSFAFFQGIFPVAGWLIGSSFKNLIASVDHWIAFALLLAVGIKMVVEGLKPEGALKKFDPRSPKVIVGLSIATSIDALVIGLGFGFLNVSPFLPVVIIGSVTFIAAMLGMLFGKSIPSKRSHQSIVLGGIILIGMGIKILVSHLWG